MVENVAEVKKALRSRLLAKRTIDLAETTEQQITEQLMGLLQQINPQRIGCYLAFGSEPRTWNFVSEAIKKGHAIACPRTLADGQMEFAEFDGKTQKNPLGFEEPTGRVVESAELDLLIIPALAIDRSGRRLGRGGGYFDRFLPGLRCPIAAVVFDSEVLESLPSEEHDVSVNFVITPSGILGF